ncbi:protein of unknown function [Pseudomonas mediterranea]
MKKGADLFNFEVKINPSTFFVPFLIDVQTASFIERQTWLAKKMLQSKIGLIWTHDSKHFVRSSEK